NFGNGDISNTQHPSKTYSTHGTYSVKLISTSDKGCKDSLSRNIVVYPPISSNTISPDQVICQGATASSLTGSNPSGGTGTFVYQWQSSSDSINWSDMAGKTSRDLSAQALYNTTYFRRIVTSAPCDSNQRSISDTVRIIVTPGITNNSISPHDTICAYF